jgi:mono/diheme cytochrome c family protein
MSKPARRGLMWMIWGLSSLLIAAYLLTGLFSKSAAGNPLLAPARSAFVPGKTTHGHYQIELACEACHAKPFGGKDALQESCVRCHGPELKEARDTHPMSKFTDPRNADRLEKLNALACVTCHSEHRPEITHPMGLSLPKDVCFECHSEIAKDRPSHANLKFDTCNSSGCHKYHDNRALYGDFLVKHARDPELSEKRTLPERDFVKVIDELGSYPSTQFPLKALAAADADATPALARDAKAVADWLATAHARSGVNCSACHTVKGDDGAATWTEKPDHKTCTTCHASEVKGFAAGKHGMRVAQSMTPMSPGMARQPMKQDAKDKTLGCVTCHGAHRFDTRKAQVESCLGCHDDTHSRAYLQSPHYALWQKELAGEAPAGSGVTCATCHLPRIEHRQEEVKRILVQHNQNDTLRPSEKMIRPTCMNCHGLGFSIDALADPQLVAANFRGRPAAHVKSIEMALDVERRAEAERRARAGTP